MRGRVRTRKRSVGRSGAKELMRDYRRRVRERTSKGRVGLIAP